jgi:hypothetical protein
MYFKTCSSQTEAFSAFTVLFEMHSIGIERIVRLEIAYPFVIRDRYVALKGVLPSLDDAYVGK